MPSFEGLGHGEASPEGWGMPELGPAPKPPEQPRFEEPSVAPGPAERPQPMAHGSAPMAAGHQLEIINNKLDAIKAILTSLELRIANLEKIAHGEEDNKKRFY